MASAQLSLKGSAIAATSNKLQNTGTNLLSSGIGLSVADDASMQGEGFEPTS